MTKIEILKIEEAGPDFVRLQQNGRTIRINFADDNVFTKEESAAFFRGLEGKPVALPLHGDFFIGVDFWSDDFGLKVVPFNFAIASVERN